MQYNVTAMLPQALPWCDRSPALRVYAALHALPFLVAATGVAEKHPPPVHITIYNISHSHYDTFKRKGNMDEEEYEFSYGEDEEDKIYINLDKRLTTNELVFHDFFKAMAVAKCLMEEDYCVMISREEKLVVLNFVETIQDGFFPRNQVYFNSCYELEDEG